MSVAQKMKQLGAKTSKSLTPDLIEKSAHEDVRDTEQIEKEMPA